MDKETLSNYGWIVICVLVLAVMIALATPFGTFVADAIKSTTQGLFDVNQSALNSTGLINIDGQEFDSCDHDYEVTTTANCTTAGTTTHTCKLCGKSYSEETPAKHTFDNSNDVTCNVCNVRFREYAFVATDYDAKMGTTTATDANVVIPETFEYNGESYKVKSIFTQYSHGPQNTGGAFYSCKNLKSVYIPSSVTVIGISSFQGCTSLENVIFENGGDQIEMICYSAFYGCENLKNIEIPSAVKQIYSYAFSGCTSLENISFTGTTDQWNAMSKGTSWNYNVPATYVQCSDGQVPLS